MSKFLCRNRWFFPCCDISANISIRWLCVELLVITLPPPVPLVVIISLAMSCFRNEFWNCLKTTRCKSLCMFKQQSSIDCAQMFQNCSCWVWISVSSEMWLWRRECYLLMDPLNDAHLFAYTEDSMCTWWVQTSIQPPPFANRTQFNTFPALYCFATNSGCTYHWS